MKLVIIDKPPSIITLYVKALLRSFRKRQKLHNLPSHTLELKQQRVDLKHLHSYQNICGFNQEKRLPITYPHIIAFPLHMQLLVDKAFPFPVIGLVHIQNTISQYQDLTITNTLNLQCQFSTMRHVDSGIEFDISTYVSSEGECVWDSMSTYLYRNKNKASDATVTKSLSPFNKNSSLEDIESFEQINTIDIKSNTGRQYGRSSHDINPIHLSRITARLFGFNAAIAHGMWSKARIIAACSKHLPTVPYTITVNFKQPLMLPSTAKIYHRDIKKKQKVMLTSSNVKRLHLLAIIKKI